MSGFAKATPGVVEATAAADFFRISGLGFPLDFGFRNSGFKPGFWFGIWD